MSLIRSFLQSVRSLPAALSGGARRKQRRRRAMLIAAGIAGMFRRPEGGIGADFSACA